MRKVQQLVGGKGEALVHVPVKARRLYISGIEATKKEHLSQWKLAEATHNSCPTFSYFHPTSYTQTAAQQTHTNTDCHQGGSPNGKS